MKIALGCDEAAIELKETIKKHLESLGYETEDYGVYTKEPSLYPDTAVKVAVSILEGKHERGILFCGTGIGMAISANKVPGIRAAVCHDIFSTERSRKSNNTQIMTLGARVIGGEVAKLLVTRWMECHFDGGGSTAKVEKIMEYEQEFREEGVRHAKNNKRS